MAYAPLSDSDRGLTRGQFREADHGHTFEYSAPKEGEFQPFREYPSKVYVGGSGAGGDQGFRWAKVLQTVAYIVTDEDANGNPVVEKWNIRGHRRYDR